MGPCTGRCRACLSPLNYHTQGATQSVIDIDNAQHKMPAHSSKRSSQQQVQPVSEKATLMTRSTEVSEWQVWATILTTQHKSSQCITGRLMPMQYNIGLAPQPMMREKRQQLHSCDERPRKLLTRGHRLSHQTTSTCAATALDCQS